MSDEPRPNEDAERALEPTSEARSLPTHAPLSASEAVACQCASCGRSWSVHRDLAGYRVRCECGVYVQVPGSALAQRASALDLVTRTHALDMSVPKQDGLFAPSTAPREVALDSALEPDALAEAKNEVRQRWTSRMLLELVLMMIAFLGPQLIVMIAVSAPRQGLYVPLASLASSLCVIAVGLLAPGYTFGSLGWPRARYFLEAAGAWALFVAFAFFWIYLWTIAAPELMKEDGVRELREVLGRPMALFVIALCPGIFEELAFRGLVQGRLSALFGSSTGLVMTAIAFACAHGITMGFPIHIALGLYLCSLRVRSGSLVPGMFLHAFYNGTIVLFS